MPRRDFWTSRSAPGEQPRPAVTTREYQPDRVRRVATRTPTRLLGPDTRGGAREAIVAALVAPLTKPTTYQPLRCALDPERDRRPPQRPVAVLSFDRTDAQSGSTAKGTNRLAITSFRGDLAKRGAGSCQGVVVCRGYSVRLNVVCPQRCR